MSQIITVEWTQDGLVRIELDAALAHDLHNVMHHGALTMEMNVLYQMLSDRLVKPHRRPDATPPDESAPTG